MTINKLFDSNDNLSIAYFIKRKWIREQKAHLKIPQLR